MNTFKENPLVSICIPSYQNSEFIAETIQSVLNQTYANIELIIVDDCSIDNTVEIIKQFTDNRITVYKNEVNLGVHANFNKALSFANGEYIKLLCGDDIIYPDCIAFQINAFMDDRNSNVSIVAVHRELIKAKGEKTFGSFYKFPAGTYTGETAIKCCIMFGSNFIGEPMAVLFRASIFKEHKIILGSNSYMIDMDMYAKLLKYGNLLVLKENLAAFRIYSGSATGTLGLKQYHQYVEFGYQEYLTAAFGIKWYHRFLGKFFTFSIYVFKGIILYFSKF